MSASHASLPRRSSGATRSWRLSLDLSPEAWLALAATAIGALLRFSTLGHQSFGVDEASTVHEVGLSFGAMIHSVDRHEAEPPLYFACAWVWTRIFSPDEVGLRSLSAVLGTAAIPVVYQCGREMIGRRAGAAAAALTAISPFMIWYSQEARAYMMLAFFSGLSLLFTARALRTGSRKDLAWWVVVSALALATHFFAALLVVPEAVWIMFRQRSRAAGVALLVLLAVEGALAPIAIGDDSIPLTSWIGGLPLHARIQGIPTEFGASQLYITSALSWGLWGAGVIVAALAVLIWRSSPQQRRRLALPGGLGAFIVLAPVIAAAVGVDYVLARNLTPAWIPLVVLIAGAAGAERARLLGLALLVAVAVLFVWADVRISSDASLQKPNWRAAARFLGPADVPRAVLIYDGNIGEEPMATYLRGTQYTFSGVPAAGPRLALREIDVVASIADTVAPHLPAGVHVLSHTVFDGNPDLYVVRFALSAPRELTPRGAGALAGSLVTPASTTLSVLLQR